MTTKNTRVLSCRVSNDVYDSFVLVAKAKGYTPGEYLKGIIERGITKQFEGSTPRETVLNDNVESKVIGSTPRDKVTPLINKVIVYKEGRIYSPGQRVVKYTASGLTVNMVVDVEGELVPFR